MLTMRLLNTSIGGAPHIGAQLLWVSPPSNHGIVALEGLDEHTVRMVSCNTLCNFESDDHTRG
jgi:hypothetical protein